MRFVAADTGRNFLYLYAAATKSVNDEIYIPAWLSTAEIRYRVAKKSDFLSVLDGNGT